ncbi:ParA family protein [Streptomyces chartreusis]|uniref:AAA family ATPase n=1 Tax=Streptomyces chartreusis TaxID=1969 RepID=A0A7H8TAB7_STRCX|nr:AAA family ATPase [Streptomyces chartreusis]QKZ20354.1 AAA family ATPase [Streptomyces chartreusis]
MSKTTLARHRRDMRPNGRNWPLLLAAFIITGGSAKTSTIIMLAVTLALRGYKVRVFDFDHQRSASHILCAMDELPAGHPTIWELMHGASLEECSVPARYVSVPANPGASTQDDPQAGNAQYEMIEGLSIVPGSRNVKNFDTESAQDGMLLTWFRELCDAYDGDDDVWLLDLPASLSKLVVSALIPFQEEDEIVPPVLVTSKEATDLKATFEELAEMRKQQNARSRIRKTEPTIKHILMCGTPTPSRPDSEGDLTVAAMKETYGEHFTLHTVKWSGVIRQQHRRQAPVHAFGNRNAAPIEDYNKVATALGFQDLNPA